ncbi:MAG: hypothetical protein CM15mP109_01050 [Candidatus Dadabacteria bacterium]|nr:MAG: hypothetical protein CM15mP109_01050 [Candidatus Dadabacteria bacterium]
MTTLLIAEHDNKILADANKKLWMPQLKLVKKFIY